MALDVFDMELADLINLGKFYRRAPRLFGRAMTGVMNDIAFTFRPMLIKEIETLMTVRSPRFVSSSIQINKARPRSNLNRIFSEVGSIKRDRFTGWAEQEFGTPTTRDRTISLLGRGGSWGSVAMGRARLRRNQKFRTPSQVTAQNRDQQMTIFLNMMRKNPRQAFIIDYEWKGYKVGLYMFKSGKLILLQNFNPKNPQPKRNRWMSKGLTKLERSFDMLKSWEKQITRQMKFR